MKAHRTSYSELMSGNTITFEVTGRRRYAVRYWIAVRLIRLASAVLGCGVEVKSID